MRLTIVIGVLAILVGGAYVLLQNSVVESRFRCEGQVASGQDSRPLTVFLKVGEYRWWVGLWSDSDGNLFIEVPNEYVEYQGKLHRVGDQLQIYDFDGDFKGNYSTLSEGLMYLLPNGLFEGACATVGN